MAILGAHMSIAGGYYKAVESAVAAGCDCVQIFTKNNNQWRAKPITQDEADRFRGAVAEANLHFPLSHTSYLINLAAADDALWQKSVDALVVELQRANQLGIADVVLHPGAHTVLTEDEGIERVIDALDQTQDRTADIGSSVLLESTAGQGTCLGWRFEQLERILNGVQDATRLGVCLDTCHLHAAGYDMRTRPQYLATIREIKRRIGLERIRAIHLNDSKRELGSRVDRHENIGRGELGLEPFRFLLNDRRFRKVPMYLETPKGEDDEGNSWDELNLAELRSLIN